MHKLGVAASGGSTRIIYQIGVAVGLEKLGIEYKITYWGGTSAGALLSAAMTMMTPKQFADWFFKNVHKRSDVFKHSWYKFWDWKGVMSLEPVREKLFSIVDGSNPRGIESVPCAVDISDNAYDRINASNKQFPKDAWLNCVMYSATVPGFMEPIHEDNLIFDGGLQEYIPIKHALTKCNKVISIATSRRVELQKDIKKNKFFWPIKGLLYLFHGINGATLKEIKVNDYLQSCRSSNVFVIEPSEELDLGIFEVPEPIKAKRIFDLGVSDVLNMKKQLLEFVNE